MVLLETLGVPVRNWDLTPSFPDTFLCDYMIALILAFTEQVNGWLRCGVDLSRPNGISLIATSECFLERNSSQ